uniref:Uncharacterized protein n=1 Tax=uncultured Planctomycetota bacterium TaxID=120965 RepID=H5SFS0_9BACT|nr:hypothetical protein HGMM_F22C11C21 [uncultured Planctomycetota bacterium]
MRSLHRVECLCVCVCHAKADLTPLLVCWPSLALKWDSLGVWAPRVLLVAQDCGELPLSLRPLHLECYS